MPELLIGCGARHVKIIAPTGQHEWTKLVKLDINPDHKPDLVYDLNDLPLPFEDNYFDEIHAYEVLEHCGQQGDYKYFFKQFADFWRILKPGGFLCGSVPLFDAPGAWGDPSHTRILNRMSFVFLDQMEYIRQIGVTAMSDFRYIYKADLGLVYIQENNGSLYFALQAHKPSRIPAEYA